MTPIKPLFDEVFDQGDAGDGQRMLRLIADLKVRVSTEGLSHGILLHRWEDATHIRVVVHVGTPAGKAAAEELLAEGFVEGPFLGPPAEPTLTEMVAKVKRATARLQLPPEMEGGPDRPVS